MNPVEQHIDFVHKIIEASGQQRHLIVALLLDAGSEVSVLHPAHEAHNHSNPACYPVHEEQIENDRPQQAQEHHNDEPAGKHRYLMRQSIPRSDGDETPGILLEMVDRQNAFLAAKLCLEALKTRLEDHILRREVTEILSVQLPVRVQQNHPVIVNQHEGHLLVCAPNLKIAKNRLKLPVLDLNNQNADILKEAKFLNQPDLRKYSLRPGQFRVLMRGQPLRNPVQLHHLLIKLAAFELIIGQRAEVLLVEDGYNLRAAFPVEIIQESIADRRMIIEQTPEIALARIQAELLSIG